MPSKRGIPVYEKHNYNLVNTVLRGQKEKKKNIDLSWFVPGHSTMKFTHEYQKHEIVSIVVDWLHL